jgi:hypothetical protein
MGRGFRRIAKEMPGQPRRVSFQRYTAFERLEERLTPAGSFGLGFDLGSAGADVAQAVSSTDGPVVAGYFSGTVNFNPGPGTTNLTSAGGKDIFVASYDRMGRLLWARSIGGPNDEEANAVAVDGYGNVYITGDYTGTVDFSGGLGTGVLTSAGGKDIFIASFTPTGAFRWAGSMGGTGDDKGLGIALDSSANSYVLVTGTFTGTANFDPGATLATSQHTLTSAGGTDAFFVKLTTAGTWQPGGADANNTYSWAERAGGPGDDGGTAVAVESGPSYYFFTGYFSGTADLHIWQGSNQSPDYHTSAGGTDVFVTQLGFWGTRDFLKTFGGPGDDRGTSIAFDPNSKSLYAGGSFHGTVDFSGGGGTGNLTSAGGSDAYVAKYAVNSGALQWAQGAGGAGDDATNALAADYTGVFAAGQYTGTADFAPGTPTYNLYDAGQGSGFLWKLDPNGNFVYARGMGGAATTQALGVSTYGFVVGRFQGTADFDQGYGGSFPLTSLGGDDGFVAKFQSYRDMVPIAYNGAFRVQAGHTLTVPQTTGNTLSSGFMASAQSRNGFGVLVPKIVSYPQHGTFSPGFYGDFTYTPANGFVGTDSFTYQAVDLSVLSNVATVTITVTPPGTDPLPTLQPIADRTIYPGQSSLGVVLIGTDADGDSLSYSAQAQSLPFALKQTYGIYEDAGGYYTNYRGQQEKYLRGQVSANGYNNGGGDYWYYILPNGDLYEFTPPYNNLALTGALVAHLGVGVYNDPSLLWNASSAAPPVTLSYSSSSSSLIITPTGGYTGAIVVTATTSDGTNSASQSFRVTIQANTPPSLAAIADQSLPTNPPPLTLTLLGSDPDLAPGGQAPQTLTYSAQAESLPYWLKQTYGLYEDAGGYYTNYRGQQEKYLRGQVSANSYNNGGGDYWYYILPSGDLYEFTPPYTNPALTGVLVAHLGTAVYSDPSLLWNAQNTTVATLSVTNNQLTITPNAGYTGSFLVIASVSDGLTSTSQTFRVVVGVNTPPTLAAIADQSIPQGQSGIVTLQGADPDGDTLTYSALAETQPYWLKQTYGIYEDSGGYYTNYRGQQEKYLRGKVSANSYNNGGGDYWYYILPNGDLYEFTPPYTNLALTGVLVAHLGTAVYNDPSLLWNAQNTAVPATLSVTGNQLMITPNAGYTGTFVVIASVSDGQTSASRTFRVTVS